VPGQISGTVTFNNSLSSHTLTIIVDLYQRYTRAIYIFVLIFLTKNYVAIAAFFANVTNCLYCVQNNITLL
jgi:hypothetical protein